MVTLLAHMPNFLVAIVGSSVRFSVGWYAARGFVLIGSCLLLTVLLIETMVLYSRLASAITLQRRERTNRLLSVEAVTGAIAHELRTPLGAIALNANAALGQLRSNPRELDEMEEILRDIEADSHRAAAMISSIREMTAKTVHRGARTSAEDVGELALRLLKHDLQLNEVSVTTEFQGNLPDVQLDGMELQQILLNLIRNAIDAMSSSPPDARSLRLKTSFDGQSTVLMSVQDSGPGISAADRARIFDPFFTTKAGGMGLGLAISSTLVAGHGGKLRLVKSDSDGSIFELEMPVCGERPLIGHEAHGSAMSASGHLADLPHGAGDVRSRVQRGPRLREGQGLEMTRGGHRNSARGQTLSARTVSLADFGVALRTRLIPGGCQVLSPAGRIEGGSVFGEYSRNTR